MAFMKPQYVREDFHVIETRHEGCVAIPADVFGTVERAAHEYGVSVDSVELVVGKFWCQLSAPGYLDCTDWDGPHDTLDDARAALADLWDCDPDTGDDDSEDAS